jgi:hypothetical protein
VTAKSRFTPSSKPAKKPGQPRPGLFAVAVALLVLGILVLASLILLGRAVQPRAPATAIVVEPTVGVLAAPTPTVGGQWSLTFEYRFPRGAWENGFHTYSMSVNCPNLPGLSGAWNGRFEAGQQHLLRPGLVYLRVSGLSDRPLGGSPVPGLHPDQVTAAALSLIFGNNADANAARADCHATMQVDAGPPLEMAPAVPAPY